MDIVWWVIRNRTKLDEGRVGDKSYQEMFEFFSAVILGEIVLSDSLRDL